MVVEVLDPAYEWPIPLPNETVYLDRLLEMRGQDGKVMARWRYQGNDSPMHEGWTVIESLTPLRASVGGWTGGVDMFGEIIQACLDNGRTLHSLPDPTGEKLPS